MFKHAMLGFWVASDIWTDHFFPKTNIILANLFLTQKRALR